MGMKRERVVIIIPTYNESGNVGRLLSILNTAVFPKLEKHYDMQVLVVDDSSPDGTADEVKQQQKNDSSIHLLLNKTKRGLGGAYTKGMWEAIDRLGADIVFEFDADLSHDPEKIAPMLLKLAEGNDMVLGSRYIAGGSIPENWGWHRKFFSIFGNLTIRIILTNFSIHDWTTGYRAIRTEVVRKILPTLDQEKFMGYTFQIGFLHHALRAGYKVAEVPFHFKDRTLGKSKLGSEYIKNTLRYILKVRVKEISQKRLFRFVVVGGVGAMVQLVSLQIFRIFVSYLWAEFLSIEAAIASNFVWSNLWTFSDRKLSGSELPVKFIQFNLTSAGSIVIQLLVAFAGERFIGLYELFRLPLVGISVDTGILFAVVGILLGMFWNFFAYSKIIWRIKGK
jgi:dolichol-phosphate mannosyltransferase